MVISKNYENISIDFVGKFSNENRKEYNYKINEDLLKLPCSILKYLNENNLKIYIMGEKNFLCTHGIVFNEINILKKLNLFKENLMRFYTDGRFIWGFCCVFISKSGIESDTVLLHEIGHLLDNKIKFRTINYSKYVEYKENKNKSKFYHSSNKEFDKCFESEKKHIKVKYYKKTRTEYFAQTFAMHIMNESDFCERFPETNKYIKKFLSNKTYLIKELT